MLHFARLATACLMVATAAMISTAQAAPAKITLLLICDIYEMAEGPSGRGGLARVATVLKNERAANANVIVVHAGDAISPSLMSSLDQGRHMIDLMGDLKLDVFVPGNHEFDFGPDVFRLRMKEASFPVLASNVRGEDGAVIAGIAATRMIELAGIRIGIAGFTAEDSVSRSSPGALQFSPTLDATLSTTAQLRKAGADLVVHAVHAPRPVDVQLMQEGAADIILSGDDHDLMMQFDGKTAIVEAMQDGWYVAAVDVHVEVKGEGSDRRVTWWPGFRFIDTAAVEPDPDMVRRVAVYENQLAEQLDQPVVTLKASMDSRNAEVRGGEAAIGNLYADAIRETLNADIALLNGGGFRGNRAYAPDTRLTRRDVLKELPFSNKAYLLQLPGRDVTQVLEQALAQADNLTGAFPQVSGIMLKADLSRPAGQRVVEIAVAGAPLDPDKNYTLATNDFLARGGNDYIALTRARELVGANDARLLTDVVISWLEQKGAVSPAIDGRLLIARQSQPQ